MDTSGQQHRLQVADDSTEEQQKKQPADTYRLQAVFPQVIYACQ
jgi:hypothetical protein